MNHHTHTPSCHSTKKKFDFLLWGSLTTVILFYLIYIFFLNEIKDIKPLFIFSESVFDLMNTIWWGLLIGIIMVGILAKIPREFVISMLGRSGGLNGIVRATLGGVLLDLCSHGILMVGAKLYERGASTGQVMAFLIASPWNSFSLTLILIALIGLKWTLLFIVLSMLIAIISGLIFEYFTSKGTLPANPNQIDLPKDFKFMAEAKKGLKETKFTPQLFQNMFWSGIKDSRIVVKWALFGVILAGLIRAFVSPEQFSTNFGPTLAGLGLTLVFATIIEVCSEGATPIAADLLTRAEAPGNSFAFLMTGIATDYTEIMVLRDTTKTWKIPLFLPLITVPQIIIISWVMNIWQ